MTARLADHTRRVVTERILREARGEGGAWILKSPPK
jgi:hypothetical protein